MEKNEIILEFGKMTTNLAGNRLGNEVYCEQVKSKIREDSLNIVKFPIEIEDIASSFIEGFYKELGEKHGKLAALEIMELHAENEDADNKIRDVIETYGV